MSRVFSILCLLALLACSQKKEKINRQAVVSRHLPVLKEADTLSAFTLGNGRFAMTMDVTGLQTFPQEYQKGIPLGTQSEWGWHSFPNEGGYSIEETLAPLESHGRQVPYARQWPANTRAGQAANYVRQNPHRIHLATVGWHLTKQDGSVVTMADLEAIDQKLDIWNGELISRFEVEGTPVEVRSVISQKDDILGVKVTSNLLATGHLGLSIRYPYPTDTFLDEAARYDTAEYTRLHLSTSGTRNLSIRRELDTTRYFSSLASSADIHPADTLPSGFVFRPVAAGDSWSFSICFSQKTRQPESGFETLRQRVAVDFQRFWSGGGMIDFGEVNDPRAAELERRMVLSRYLTHIQCGGRTPPQETGLTYNSWYGKPHLEMAWWHGVHFALWGEPEVLEGHMDWYLRNGQPARQMAERQGFGGVRWQKMTDPHGGETSSSVGSYLIWQQPHIIYFAELLWQMSGDKSLLEKYHETIEQTANFMADFAWYDPSSEHYVLGPGVIPAQERFDPAVTFNPTYELAYWRWGLETAQQWRERQGLERHPKWDQVLTKLSPLSVKDGLYLAAESAPDSYTIRRYMTDHPSVLGTFGMLPATDGLDRDTMRSTFMKIWNDWQWEDTWGWDFPMTAMTATRLGMPEKAVEALLMPITTNTYLKNGHNYQNERLRLYLPGNGGLLTALAMMAAGTGDNLVPVPGFPAEWNIRHEGLHKMP